MTVVKSKKGDMGNVVWTVKSKQSDSNRTYSGAVGPYKKGSLVVKKKKAGVIDPNDAIKYGDLSSQEASVMFEVYEDGGFNDRSLKLATSLQKKGYITYKKNPGAGPKYAGVVTKKGEQWVKDYENGKFDATLEDAANMDWIEGYSIFVEDDGSLSIREGRKILVRFANVKSVNSLLKVLPKAIKKMQEAAAIGKKSRAYSKRTTAARLKS